MRGRRRRAALSTCATLVTMVALTALLGGFATVQERGDAAAFHGREVIKIVSTKPGPMHAKVTAKGAFKATGHFVRRKASLVFPKGKLVVRRHLTTSSVSPPNLRTCFFREHQAGTFRVTYATGKYKRLRYNGQFTTSLTGHLKKSGHDQCSSKIAKYRAVTTETGTIR
ncbi:MAG TPA: hypothetical protein VFQ44_14295 [Streptosporangiaceae bacterium]|nr:hypothetical protein [Streptosporangiaceae bacterium]